MTGDGGMWNLIVLAMIFCAAAALYYWRAPLLARLRRFDAANAARRRAEIEARYDPLAHYRETLRLADEQVEPISELREADPRTGQEVTLYLFLATRYARREEALAAREEAIAEAARAFYADLDRVELGRTRAGPGHRLPPPGKS
jgi:hypothetical protein